jgi:hypothetical protein
MAFEVLRGVDPDTPGLQQPRSQRRPGQDSVGEGMRSGVGAGLSPIRDHGGSSGARQETVLDTARFGQDPH